MLRVEFPCFFLFINLQSGQTRRYCETTPGASIAQSKVLQHPAGFGWFIGTVDFFGINYSPSFNTGGVVKISDLLIDYKWLIMTRNHQ